MELSYNKFMKMIPEETKIYVERVLYYIRRFIVNDYNVSSDYDISSYDDYNTKLVASCILALDGTRYESFIKQRGYEKRKFYGSDCEKIANSNMEDAFNHATKLFQVYTDDTRYASLLSIDLLEHAIKLRDKAVRNSSNLNVDGFYNNYFGENTIRKDISEYVVAIHKELDAKKEKQLYGDLPFSTIYYLQTAAKIRTIILNRFDENRINETPYLKKDNDYLVPISLMMAIFEYDGNDKNMIEQYFESVGLSQSNLQKLLNLYISNEISDTYLSLDSIEQLYLRYAVEGKNQGVEQERIQIIDIIPNLIDRKFTNSTALEGLLNALHIPGTIFDDYYAKIHTYSLSSEERSLEDNYRNFFKDIQKDTKEFIMYCCKVYQLLMDKMKESKHNTEILKGSDDADTLAIYIAAHFFHGDIDQFYQTYGVTYDKVMELVGINISSEEINAVTLDKSILMNKFKRFIDSGVNSRKSNSEVTISDVIHNLCNRDFNQSTIMEDVFEEINRYEHLEKDFYDRLTKYVEKVEVEEKRKKYEEYFQGLPVEDIEYLTNLSIIFKNFSSKSLIDKYGIENCKVLALLGAMFSLGDSQVKDYFVHLGLDKSSISKIVTGSTSNYYSVSGSELDVDILRENFDEYVFGGFHKESKKEDIHIIDIVLNVFNKDIFHSVFLTKLFADISFDTTKFENGKGKEEYQQYVDKTTRQLELDHSLKTLGDTHYNVIKKSFGFYELYSKELQGEELEVLSILLAFFEYPYYSNFEFVKKRGLTKELLLETLHVKEHSFKGSNSEVEIIPHLQKYISKDINLLLLQVLETNTFKKIATNLGLNLDSMVFEVKTGTSYESSLTIQDGITLLDKLEVEEITGAKEASIPYYGGALLVHNSYIQSKYPKLMMSGTLEEATDGIKKLLDSIYTEEEVHETKKRGFFASLFSDEIDSPKKQVKFDSKAMETLSSMVDEQIRVLGEELKTFSQLREYMILYKKKNDAYVQKAVAYLQALDSGEIKLDSSGDELIDSMNFKSYRRVLQAKIESLRTSDILLQQQIVRLYQVVMNHCITINSLMMSRDTLLPIIGTEVIIHNGIATQGEGLDTSRQLIQLFESVMSNDIAGTESVLDKMKGTILSDEQLQLIRSNVNQLLSQLGDQQDGPKLSLNPKN